MVRAYPGRNRPGISRIGVVIVVIAIVVVAGGVGYFYLPATPSATKGSTLKIGMTLSESGIFASLDGNYTHFNDAWQTYVNSNGGLVDGSGVHHNVTIISYDDQSQHDLAVSQYHRLAEQDNVSFLISPYSADIGEDLIPVAQADKVPLIMAEASSAGMWVPSNPHDWAVTSMVPYWQVDFTTGCSGSYFSMLKQQITANPNGSPKTIAFVGWDITWANDDFNSSLNLAPQAGLSVVYQKLLQPDFTNPVAGFQAIIPDLKAANPDIVYLATFGPVAALWMKAASQSGFQPQQWHTIEWGAAFASITGQQLASHTTTEVFWTPTFASQQQSSGFADEALFNQLVTKAGVTWYNFQNIELRMIIFEMIAKAVSQVSSPTRANLNNALHQLNMPTVGGKLVVQPQGYGTIGLVPVQWHNGRIQTLFPSSLANATYVFP